MPKAKNTKVQKTGMTDKITELLKQPYSRILIPDPESGTYAAHILEFPGCVAQGDTPDEAYANLENAAEGWIQAALDLGQEIPEPFLSQGFGGKIALRLPRSIHRQAALMAEQDNTSLNQFLLSAISERVGAENLYARMVGRLHREFSFATINMIKATVWVNTGIAHPPDTSFRAVTTSTVIGQLLINPQQLSEGNRQHA